MSLHSCICIIHALTFLTKFSVKSYALLYLACHTHVQTSSCWGMSVYSVVKENLYVACDNDKRMKKTTQYWKTVGAEK